MTTEFLPIILTSLGVGLVIVAFFIAIICLCCNTKKMKYNRRPYGRRISVDNPDIDMFPDTMNQTNIVMMNNGRNDELNTIHYTNDMNNFNTDYYTNSNDIANIDTTSHHNSGGHHSSHHDFGGHHPSHHDSSCHTTSHHDSGHTTSHHDSGGGCDSGGGGFNSGGGGCDSGGGCDND